MTMRGLSSTHGHLRIFLYCRFPLRLFDATMAASDNLVAFGIVAGLRLPGGQLEGCWIANAANARESNLHHPSFRILTQALESPAQPSLSPVGWIRFEFAAFASSNPELSPADMGGARSPSFDFSNNSTEI